MAAPTLSLLGSTSIDTAESTTGWTKFDTLDPDIVKEGSNGITGTFRTDLTTGYFDNGSAPITAVDKTFRMWINTTNVAYMETETNGGYELLVYDGTTTQYITIFSSDDYYGGWFQVVMDMNDFTSLTLANVQRWGIRINHHTSAKNIDNVWVDALKYLDGYSMTGGTSGDEITLATIEVADRGTTTLYGYGVLTVYGSIYYCTGDVQLGTGATTMYFEMDGEILVFEDKPIAEGLYSLSGVGSGSNVVITNSVITAAGTTDATRFIFDWSDTNLASFSCTNNRIVRAAASTFKSGQTVTGNTFDNCGQITPDGADLTDCIVKNYEGTADTGAVLYNNAADPDGELDNMSFTKGTAATHAIEFGTTSPLTMTLRDIDFSGYTNTIASTSAPVYIKRTSGTVTINLDGCTGITADGYKTDGATVVIATSVPITITVKDVAGNLLTDVQTAVYKISDRTEIMNEDTVAGVATESYTGSTPVDVEVRCRRASSGTTRYINFSSNQTIGISGLTLSVTMREDPNNNATT